MLNSQRGYRKVNQEKHVCLWEGTVNENILSAKLIHPILLTKTDCASASLQKVNLMLYQVSTINFHVVARRLDDLSTNLSLSLWGGDLLVFTKDFSGHAWNTQGKTLKPAVPSWDLAHSSNSFRKSMLSANTCNMQKECYHWPESPQEIMAQKLCISRA
jgi:hypothetical protein